MDFFLADAEAFAVNVVHVLLWPLVFKSQTVHLRGETNRFTVGRLWLSLFRTHSLFPVRDDILIHKVKRKEGKKERKKKKKYRKERKQRKEVWKKTKITSSFFRARGAYLNGNDKTIIQTSDDRVRMGVGHCLLSQGLLTWIPQTQRLIASTKN